MVYKFIREYKDYTQAQVEVEIKRLRAELEEVYEVSNALRSTIKTFDNLMLKETRTERILTLSKSLEVTKETYNVYLDTVHEINERMQVLEALA